MPRLKVQNIIGSDRDQRAETEVFILYSVTISLVTIAINMITSLSVRFFITFVSLANVQFNVN